MSVRLNNASKYAGYSVLACLAPVLVHLIWLLNNTQIPTADADGPLMSSLTIYRHAVDHEWLKFIKGLYTTRDWRPTALYLVELPFQFIGGGDLRFASSASSLACLEVTCLYIYCLLRLALTPPLAILATALLGLLPMAQWPGGFFASTEDAFMPAVLATVYHLIRSDNLCNKRHSFYFALAASACFGLRPVESITHIIPVFALFLIAGWRRRIFTDEQIYILLVEAMLCLCVLVLMGLCYNGVTFHSAIFDVEKRGTIFMRAGKLILGITLALLGGGVICSITAQWRLNKGLARPYIIPAFSLILALATLYYLNFVPQVVEWVYSTSIGDIAGGIKRVKPVDIARLFIGCAGIMPFVGITLLGAVSYLYCLKPEQRQQLLRHPLLYLLAMVPVTLVLPFISIQYTPRKITIIVIAFLLLMLIPALLHGKWWRTRLCVITVIAAWQCGGMMWIAADHPFNTLLDDTIGFRDAFPDLVSISPNPHDTVADFMIESAKRHGYGLIIIPVIGNARHLVDPFLLGMIIEIRGHGLHSPFPYIPVYDDQSIKKIVDTTSAQAMLIAPEQPLKKTPEEAAHYRMLRDATQSSTYKVAYELLARFSEGTLESTLGLRKSDCQVIVPTGIEVCIYEIPHPVK